jgi:hypothetical protein
MRLKMTLTKAKSRIFEAVEVDFFLQAHGDGHSKKNRCGSRVIGNNPF